MPQHPELTGDDSILDVGGLRVGHWTNRRAATGCTVLLAPPEGAIAAADVRGGAPGTRETDLLDAGRVVQRVHAILLAGGSAFGLDAAGGVMRYLEERGTGHRMRDAVVPIVAGAVIFDLGTGLGHIRPDADSGRKAAISASSRRLEQGSVGAGTGATVAKLGGAGFRVKGGLGSASESLSGGVVVGALAVVNAVGDIIDPCNGATIAGRLGTEKSDDVIEYLRRLSGGNIGEGSNTTLVAVATNAALTKDQAHRVAAMAHDGIARTTRPSHTPMDGDTVFALSTGEIPIAETDLVNIGGLGARAVERAILRGVLRATSLAGVATAGELQMAASGRK